MGISLGDYIFVQRSCSVEVLGSLHGHAEVVEAESYSVVNLCELFGTRLFSPVKAQPEYGQGSPVTAFPKQGQAPVERPQSRI